MRLRRAMATAKMSWTRMSARRWRTVRRDVLERDGWVCQLGRAGCTGIATTVDHVIEVRRLAPDDPRRYDARNLRSACAPCNGDRNRDPRRRRAGLRSW